MILLTLRYCIFALVTIVVVEMIHALVVLMIILRMRQKRKNIENKKILLDDLIWDRIKDYLIGDDTRRYWIKVVKDAYNYNRTICGATHPLICTQNRVAAETLVHIKLIKLDHGDGEIIRDTPMTFLGEMQWRVDRIHESKEERLKNNNPLPRRIFTLEKDEDGDYIELIFLSAIEP